MSRPTPCPCGRHGDGDEPDYVVVRPAPDLPLGFLPDDLNGRWFDRSTMPRGPACIEIHTLGAIAVATGRFETRADGAVAEVFEVRP